MFNRVSSLILAILLFLVSLWSTSKQNSSSLTVFVISLGLFIFSSLIVNWKRLGPSWPHLFLPAIYLVGFGSIFVSITASFWHWAFLILACLIFYLVEVQLGRESHFLQNIYLFSVFAIFLGLFSLQFYLSINYILFACLVFLAAYILISQGFAGFSLPVKKYFSLLIALVCAESALGLSLWPTYYMVGAMIIFAIFYLLWVFSFSAFFGKLSRNKIYWQLSFVSFIIVIVLLTSTFSPLTR